MARSYFRFLVIYENETTEMCIAQTIQDVIDNVKGESNYILSIVCMGLNW